MLRNLETELQTWLINKNPKPILLRGARQVGKTYLVEIFAKKHFKHFLKINFEKEKTYHKLFDKDLNMKEILQKIAISKGIEFSIENTLVFFDEIQECPQAITSLRYIYEDLPGLHCIAAGSFLEIVLNEKSISMPVGRIQYLYLHPISFHEYLIAINKSSLVDYIKNFDFENHDDFFHEILLKELQQYLFLGGMPKVLESYLKTNNLQEAINEQNLIIDTFRDDFRKYGSKAEYKYIEKVFDNLPKLNSHSVKYSQIDSEAQSRELKNALEILVQAKIYTQVFKTSGASLPLKFNASHKHFKTVCLDIGLMNNLLAINNQILLSDNALNLASGAIAEDFVGQELIAYTKANQKPELYYWSRDGRNISAEVDYLIGLGSKVFGLEVKAGLNARLNSLYSFMKEYQHEHGICISPAKPLFKKGIFYIPIYAVSEIERLVSTTNTNDKLH